MEPRRSFGWLSLGGTTPQGAEKEGVALARPIARSLLLQGHPFSIIAFLSVAAKFRGSLPTGETN